MVGCRNGASVNGSLCVCVCRVGGILVRRMSLSVLRAAATTVFVYPGLMSLPRAPPDTYMMVCRYGQCCAY